MFETTVCLVVFASADSGLHKMDNFYQLVHVFSIALYLPPRFFTGLLEYIAYGNLFFFSKTKEIVL